MDLFAKPVVQAVSLDDLIAGSVASIEALFMVDVPTVVAVSMGKDSSALTVLTFMAALNAMDKGKRPRIAVFHADTGIENPIIHALAMRELQKVEAFAQQCKIALTVHVSSPALLDSWGPRICGGRALPSYPTLNTDCATEWKVDPIKRLRQQMLPELEAAGQEVVTLTGTRRTESIARGLKMLKRRDSSEAPVRNKAGDLVLSPIAEWDSDSVFELLGLCSSGVVKSYTDAQEVLTAYRDAGPSSCAVVNDSLTEGQTKKGGCSSRFGCSLCVAVYSDKSMQHLLDSDEQYGFMRGLGRLRDYLAVIQDDMSRRLWVGRTIRCGHIAIRPDVFSPEEMRNIYRMAVTLDVEEAENSGRANVEPRFRLIPADAAIAIDMLWSRDGHHDGFAAIDDYLQIWEDGARYPVPESVTIGSTIRPEPRFLKVGENWADACGDHWAGIREPFAAAMLEDCIETRTFGKKESIVTWDVVSEDGFQIDLESLAMFFMFEARRMVDQYKNCQRETRGIAYRWYLQYGIARISARQVLTHDKSLRRTAFKRFRGLSGPGVDVKALLGAAKPWDEVSEEVQRAFLSESRIDDLEAKKESERLLLRQRSLF